jgi:Ribonuclease G/E
LTKVRLKGANGYLDFKTRLKMTNQSNLAELLSYKENGFNTKEIEHQLDQMVEDKLTSTEYDEIKRSK